MHDSYYFVAEIVDSSIHTPPLLSLNKFAGDLNNSVISRWNHTAPLAAKSNFSRSLLLQISLDAVPWTSVSTYAKLFTFSTSESMHNEFTTSLCLQELGLANSDHTTLLLNTYKKLKDVSRLDSFIKTESRRNSNDSNELPLKFWYAGYFEHGMRNCARLGPFWFERKQELEDIGELLCYFFFALSFTTLLQAYANQDFRFQVTREKKVHVSHRGPSPAK